MCGLFCILRRKNRLFVTLSLSKGSKGKCFDKLSMTYTILEDYTHNEI